MTPPAINSRLVGIGSHHGDDQAGWAVADVLQTQFGSTLDVRKLSVPVDLLHWLDGLSLLHIVDACSGTGDVGFLHRWEWSQFREAGNVALHSAGSHDFDVRAVLCLAEQLGRLPEQIVIWGIQGGSFTPSDAVSPEIEHRIGTIAATIARELTHARNVTRAIAADEG